MAPSRNSSNPSAPTLTIASVPASHVYVRHLSDGGDDVVRLPDPTSEGRATGSPWWPPAMLDSAWVTEHADDFDVFHLHFGFDARTPTELAQLVEALRRADKPLVFTVHDLRNPHHLDRTDHDRQLDVLVPAADEVITLTRGAATEILVRWGRVATVVPHPHVVELPVAARIRRRRDVVHGPFRVGLHVKSLRACMDAVAVLPALVEAVEKLPDAVLQVNGHRDVLEPGGARFDAELAGLLDDLGPRVDLRVHDFLPDDELWDYLGGLDVSVLPYRHGTHSGWLEACHDLGTQVVAPSCGHYADQGAVHTYVMDDERFDPDSLVQAVRRAHDRPLPRIDLAGRLEQRRRVAATHRAVYAWLVA